MLVAIFVDEKLSIERCAAQTKPVAPVACRVPLASAAAIDVVIAPLC